MGTFANGKTGNRDKARFSPRRRIARRAVGARRQADEPGEVGIGERRHIAWRAVLPQTRERLLDGERRTEERRHRVQHHGEAHGLQIGRAQRGGLVAVDDGDDLRPRQVPRHGLHLGDLLDAVDEDQVDARVLPAPGARERLFDAGGRQRIGAPDDQHGIVAARGHRAAQPALVLARVDQADAGHLAAALRGHLVLEVDGGHAGLDVLAHRALDVRGAAVAGVGIGDHRHADGAHHVARVAGHLGLRHEADVGLAQPRRGGAEAGHIDDREAGALDLPRAQRVVGARCLDDGTAGEQGLQGQCGMQGHGLNSSSGRRRC